MFCLWVRTQLPFRLSSAVYECLLIESKTWLHGASLHCIMDNSTIMLHYFEHWTWDWNLSFTIILISQCSVCMSSKVRKCKNLSLNSSDLALFKENKYIHYLFIVLAGFSTNSRTFYTIVEKMYGGKMAMKYLKFWPGAS